ncbi:MAG: acetate kinase [Myxococcota bacterium]|jgi:acetate kinase
MHVLVLNCGSSSLKAALIHSVSGVRVRQVHVDRIGDGATLSVDGQDDQQVDAPDHTVALSLVLALFADDDVEAVGHRVVHGGAAFTRPTAIDDDVEQGIQAASALAPLHNPANLAGIRAARAALADVPHVAVFDTAFHATLPRRARTYALPAALAESETYRRYGFHGPSHSFVAKRAADALEEDIRDLRIISCHLGNGASVCAVEYGRSVDTSMGLTPLEGLVMGTRSGDIDPGLVLQLVREHGVERVDVLLNRESGLAGLSGVGRDLRDVEAAAENGDDRAGLAIAVAAHRLRKYIASFAAVMGGVDVVVFTGGIGQNSGTMRHRALQRMEFMGIRLDETVNRSARASADEPVISLHRVNSRVRILAVHTDEEQAIARAVLRVVNGGDRAEGPMIPVAISARHVHLTQAHVEALFGEGATLTPKIALTQPGQFACKERVALVGPRGRIDKVRVIGPARGRTQVEVARTDEFKLGVDAPVRMSGDLDNTPGLTLEGPEGSVDLESGVICSQRHIHMTPADAERFGVSHKDVVEVALDTEGRDLVFGDVVVRVKDSYALEMHVDTDEGNAAELVRGVQGVLSTTGKVASIRRRDDRFDLTESRS